MLHLEAPPGFEPGIRVLQTRALPLGYSALYIKFGAGNGAQTRDLCLGKAALYQLSYSRVPNTLYDKFSNLLPYLFFNA